MGSPRANNQAIERVSVAQDVRPITLEERDGKVHIAPANDSLVKIDELIASIKAMRGARQTLNTTADTVRQGWAGGSVADKNAMTRDLLITLTESVQGLTNIVAWLTREELRRMKGR